MDAVSLAGLGAVGYRTDGSTVVKGIDMGAALLWLLRHKSGPGWCVLLLVYPLTQWLEQPLVQAARGCRLSVMEAFGQFNLLPLCRAVRTWKSGHFFLALVSLSPCPVFGCCLWCAAFWIFSGDPACSPLGSTVDTCSSSGFGRILHIFYVAVNSNPDAFRLHSRRMESVHSRCFWF